jgi:hypothetical protein
MKNAADAPSQQWLQSEERQQHRSHPRVAEQDRSALAPGEQGKQGKQHGSTGHEEHLA